MAEREGLTGSLGRAPERAAGLGKARENGKASGKAGHALHRPAWLPNSVHCGHIRHRASGAAAAPLRRRPIRGTTASRPASSRD